MKKYLVFVSILALTSCKEKGPIIDFGGSAQATDTTYTAAVETPEQKKVLVEEFTGAGCTNCPAGADLLAGIAANNPGRVIIAALHVFKNGTIFEPVKDKSKYDFRTQKGTDMADLIYPGLGSLPNAGIDRMTYSNSTIIDKGAWSQNINTRLALTTPVNVKIESSYDAATKKATITVTAAYTQAVTTKNYLTVAIIEDSIVDAQEFPFKEIKMDYVFKHTFRDYLTPVGGAEILSTYSTKEAGRVYKRTFVYDVDGKWNPEHCEVVAFIHNNEATNKDVIQAAEHGIMH